MAATVYKKTTYNEVQNRTIQKCDDTTSSLINNTLFSFVTYFKAKHL
jgi:hypothetical protein